MRLRRMNCLSRTAGTIPDFRTHHGSRLLLLDPDPLDHKVAVLLLHAHIVALDQHSGDMRKSPFIAEKLQAHRTAEFPLCDKERDPEKEDGYRDADVARFQPYTELDAVVEQESERLFLEDGLEFASVERFEVLNKVAYEQ